MLALVAQAEVVGAGKHLCLSHADRVEAHGTEDKRYQGKAQLPFEADKVCVGMQNQNRYQQDDVIACQEAAVEDAATLLQ